MEEGPVLTTLKILIIGESGVGKSRLIITNTFTFLCECFFKYRFRQSSFTIY